MKKSFIKKPGIIVVIASLVLATIVAVGAAVYIASYARMGLFRGHIEQVSSQQDGPKLVLKVCGQNVGQSDDYYTKNDVVFPILTNATSVCQSVGPTIWQDEDGKEALCAPEFVLTAENGTVDNVFYKIAVHGNDQIAEALCFGVSIGYADKELGGYSWVSGTQSVAYGQTETVPSPLKSANNQISENEEVKILVSVWVDSDALAEIGEYENTSFTVDIIFSAEE